MLQSAGEAYTHLLIPVAKSYRPPMCIVEQFLEEMIEAGVVGQIEEIRFAIILRVDPKMEEKGNPFESRPFTRRTPSRMRQRPQSLSSIAQLREVVSEGQEYEVTITSGAAPRFPPLIVGTHDLPPDCWRPQSDDYHLEIRFNVRNTVVRLYELKPADWDAPRPEIWVPVFDEDCDEEETEGVFEHPESADVIQVPNAGCGRFWIEFVYGKWLYPRLTNPRLALLDERVTKLANETFATEFVQGCLWR